MDATTTVALAGVVVAGLGLHALARWTGAVEHDRPDSELLAGRHPDARRHERRPPPRPAHLDGDGDGAALAGRSRPPRPTPDPARGRLRAHLRRHGLGGRPAPPRRPAPPDRGADRAGRCVRLSLGGGRRPRDHAVLRRDGVHVSRPGPPQRPPGRRSLARTRDLRASLPGLRSLHGQRVRGRSVGGRDAGGAGQHGTERPLHEAAGCRRDVGDHRRPVSSAVPPSC